MVRYRKAERANIGICIALSFDINFEYREVIGRARAKSAAGSLVTIDTDGLPCAGRGRHVRLRTAGRNSTSFTAEHFIGYGGIRRIIDAGGQLDG